METQHTDQLTDVSSSATKFIYQAIVLAVKRKLRISGRILTPVAQTQSLAHYEMKNHS